MGKLDGKIAVVTGASRGLGAAMALRLAKDGATIAIHYGNSQSEAEKIAAEVRSVGSRAVIAGGDLSSVAGIDGFYQALDQALKAETGDTRFDILIANAGVAPSAIFAETTEADFDRVFNINVKGVFFTIQHALPRLRDGGRVMTVSSGLTRFAYPQFTAYAATKGAINILTTYLAAQLGPRGITVNAIAPGAIDTDLNAGWLRDNPDAQKATASTAALGRVGQPDDIADVAAFLASDDSRWVTAQHIEASGGAHL